MAATVTKTGNAAFTISEIDDDWTWTDTFTQDAYVKGIRVWSLLFQPGAIGDVLSMRNGSASESLLFPDNTFIDLKPQIVYCGNNILKPFIDYSESTFSSGHKVIAIIGNTSLTR